jgi:hypothetical protein
MKQLITSIPKLKQQLHISANKTRLTPKHVLAIPVEWKLLFALLVLMGLRLAMIVTMLIKQL